MSTIVRILLDGLVTCLLGDDDLLCGAAKQHDTDAM